MLRILQIALIGLLVNFYWFPVVIKLIPLTNTKSYLAVVGLVMLILEILRRRQYEFPKSLFWATALALGYSVTNLVAVELNDTNDFTYASYITSFAVWLFSAYTVVEAIRWGHKQVSIRLITSYLATICTIQSVLAILMDKFEGFKQTMNDIFDLSEEFMESIDRLYGVGAMLDPAGTRFAVVLILIACVLSIDEKIKQSTLSILWYFICFLVISVLGNMISRTTTTGTIISLIILFLSTGIYRLRISGNSISILRVLVPLLIIGIPGVIILYNTDAYWQELFRFGFEGFFKWIETGEFTTGSTEVLATMWQWPETTKGWIIGTGKFGFFYYGTDIGYCRLVLYSGLIGFSIFALFFVYNAYVFIAKYRRYRYMFLALLALTFIIWYKVSTDIFMIYALFYCFDDEEEMGYTPKISFA